MSRGHDQRPGTRAYRNVPGRVRPLRPRDDRQYAIAPNIRLGTILRGAFPFMIAMVIGIVALFVFPEIAAWLPDAVMSKQK